MRNIKPFAEPFLGVPVADSNALMDQVRASGKNALILRTVPTRKTENWRYSARHLDLSPELASPLPVATGITDILAHVTPLGEHRVVFINGRFQSGLSHFPEDNQGLMIEPLSAAGADDTLLSQLSAPAQLAEHPFAAVNGANLLDGIRIKIASKSRIESPIQVIFATTDDEGSAHARLLIESGQSSEATVIEEYVSLQGQATTQRQFNTAITQVAMAPNATLNLVRLSLEPETIQHVGLTLVEQTRDSQFHAHNVGFGGKLKRHDIQVKLQEAGAFCRLNGAYLTRNAQHYDNHTRIEHIAPNCESSETYRGIADNESHAVFNGQILIHRDAQKSLANMSNKNLLLSSEAEIDTKPELEIYADDVKCAHGATIGQLDKESLFYLVSRGIAPEKAASMLSMGFINELLEQIPCDKIQEILEARLQQFLHDAFSGARPVIQGA